MVSESEYYCGIGRRIREARKQVGLTQQDLADEVDLSRTSITNIESGNQAVSVWLLHRLAAAMDRDAVDLLPPSSEVGANVIPGDVPARAAAFIRSLERLS